MPSIYDYINRFRNTVDNAWRDTGDNYWRKIGKLVSIVYHGRGTQEESQAGAKKSHQADFGRKPYMYGLKRHSPKSDYHDMMRELPLRAQMDQRLAKQSEFEKPYLHEDYQEMQYLWPGPPGFMFPPFDMPKFKIPTAERWGGHGCIIFCNSPMECNEPVQCSPAIFQYWGLTRDRYKELSFKIKLNGSTHGDYELHEQAVFPLVINPPSVDNVFGPNYVKRWAMEAPYDVLTIVMKDGADNICTDELTVMPMDCPEADVCDCDDVVEFSFNDTGTADTIVGGGSITVRVSDGCPPFDWSTTASGYSFESAKTWNRTNILTSDTGTCGVDYDAVCVFVVTDNCGTNVGGSPNGVRSTGGHWDDAYVNDCLVTSGVETCNKIHGNKKYHMHWTEGCERLCIHDCYVTLQGSTTEYVDGKTIIIPNVSIYDCSAWKCFYDPEDQKDYMALTANGPPADCLYILRYQAWTCT